MRDKATAVCYCNQMISDITSNLLSAVLGPPDSTYAMPCGNYLVIIRASRQANESQMLVDPVLFHDDRLTDLPNLALSPWCSTAARSQRQGKEGEPDVARPIKLVSHQEDSTPLSSCSVLQVCTQTRKSCTRRACLLQNLSLRLSNCS